MPTMQFRDYNQYYNNRSGSPSGKKGIILLVLFLITTWFSLPPWGTVDTDIISSDRDYSNTYIYVTVEVQNNTHTFAYHVETEVTVTDSHGDTAGSQTQKIAGIMFPKAKKKVKIRIPITRSNTDTLHVNVQTESWALIRAELPGMGVYQ